MINPVPHSRREVERVGQSLRRMMLQRRITLEALSRVIGLSFRRHRSSLSRVVRNRQACPRAWVPRIAAALAPECGAAPADVEAFLVGIAPPPNVLCGHGAETEAVEESEYSALWGGASAGADHLLTAVSISSPLPWYLLPHRPRARMLKGLAATTKPTDRSRFIKLANVAEDRHEKWLLADAAAGYSGHFICGRDGVSALCERRPPYHHLEQGDVIDAVGFLVQDVIDAGRGRLSAVDWALCPIAGLLPAWSGIAMIERLENDDLLTRVRGDWIIGRAPRPPVPGSLLHGLHRLIDEAHVHCLSQQVPERTSSYLRQWLANATR